MPRMPYFALGRRRCARARCASSRLHIAAYAAAASFDVSRGEVSSAICDMTRRQSCRPAAAHASIAAMMLSPISASHVEIRYDHHVPKCIMRLRIAACHRGVPYVSPSLIFIMRFASRPATARSAAVCWPASEVCIVELGRSSAAHRRADFGRKPRILYRSQVKPNDHHTGRKPSGTFQYYRIVRFLRPRSRPRFDYVGAGTHDVAAFSKSRLTMWRMRHKRQKSASGEQSARRTAMHSSKGSDIGGTASAERESCRNRHARSIASVASCFALHRRAVSRAIVVSGDGRMPKHFLKALHFGNEAK